MKNTLSIIAIILTSACAHTATSSESGLYSQSEIATVSTSHFGKPKGVLQKALTPTFKKYGQPSGYISGQMSSAVEDLDRLHGTGYFQAKFKLAAGTYWKIDGSNFNDLYSPIPTLHLVYDLTDLGSLGGPFNHIGSLSRKGQEFTVFEQMVDNQIIVTVYKTGDLPTNSQLNTLAFARIQNSGLMP